MPINRYLIKGLHVLGVRAGESGRRDPSVGDEDTRAVLELAKDGSLRPHISVALAARAGGARPRTDARPQNHGTRGPDHPAVSWPASMAGAMRQAFEQLSCSSRPSVAAPSHHLGHQRARHLAVRLQRPPVDFGDDPDGRLHRALHAQRDLLDDLRLDRQLPVGEQLDEHGAQQGVVGRLDAGQRRLPQPRAQVGQVRCQSPGSVRAVTSTWKRCSRARLSRWNIARWSRTPWSTSSTTMQACATRAPPAFLAERAAPPPTARRIAIARRARDGSCPSPPAPTARRPDAANPASGR